MSLSIMTRNTIKKAAIRGHIKNLLFLRLKYFNNLLSYCSYVLSFQGKFNVIKIPMVIYHHSTVITKVMLLYNTE
jgi:hypothetical protein